MPVEQGLPWHPVATGLAGQAIPFVVAASRAHAPPFAPFWFPVPAVLVILFPPEACRHRAPPPPVAPPGVVVPHEEGVDQGCAEREEGGGGGGGSGTPKFVYQKCPDKSFPIANFVFFHDGHFGLGGIQGERGG